MVLEETLVFDTADDADKFVSFLRGHEVHVQKVTGSYFFDETMMEGPIKNLIEVYSGAVAPVDDLSEERRKTRDAANSFLTAHLTSIRDYVGEVMGRYQEGDLVVPRDEIEKNKAALKEEALEKSEDLKDTLLSRIPIEDALIAMENAGIVKTEPDGIRLVKKIDPDALPLQRRLMEPDYYDVSTLKAKNLTVNHLFYFETETRLFIDPRIHIALEPEVVREALIDLEVDEESADELLMNMATKQVSITCIMDAISRSGRISLPDLITIVDAVSVPLKDSESLLTAYITPSYATSIVNDLRKLGLVEGNDRKLRVAR